MFLHPDILSRVKHKYEKHHNMDIGDDVLKAVVNMADQYVKSRFFPDKALDLLDDACAIKRVKHNARLGELAKQLEEARKGELSLVRFICDKGCAMRCTSCLLLLLLLEANERIKLSLFSCISCLPGPRRDCRDGRRIQ